jgi:uncharacterized protein with PIN domain
MAPDDKAVARCSFCGKPRDEVRSLVPGPAVSICDECVAVCNEILIDLQAQDDLDSPEDSLTRHAGTFNCPKCGAAFALHSEHREPPAKS